MRIYKLFKIFTTDNQQFMDFLFKLFLAQNLRRKHKSAYFCADIPKTERTKT